jgi:NAD(P)-dependent dehydrogenase (short-subunit alcohol dehydrogenase family)
VKGSRVNGATQKGGWVVKLSGASVVVTGGGRVLGSHVVDQFLAASSDVLVIDNLSTGRRDNLRRGR